MRPRFLVAITRSGNQPVDRFLMCVTNDLRLLQYPAFQFFGVAPPLFAQRSTFQALPHLKNQFLALHRFQQIRESPLSDARIAVVVSPQPVSIRTAISGKAALI